MYPLHHFFCSQTFGNLYFSLSQFTIQNWKLAPCTRYLSLLWKNNQQQLRRCLFGVHDWGETVYWGGETMATGVWDSWSHCVHGQEADKKGCWDLAPCRFLHSQTPAHGMMLLPTFRVVQLTRNYSFPSSCPSSLWSPLFYCLSLRNKLCNKTMWYLSLCVWCVILGMMFSRFTPCLRPDLHNCKRLNWLCFSH